MESIGLVLKVLYDNASKKDKDLIRKYLEDKKDTYEAYENLYNALNFTKPD